MVRPQATFTAEQVAALANASAMVTGQSAPMPREAQVPFGPGMPIFPAAIDPVREDTKRPEPRINEYPVTINLPGMTDRIVPWKILRDASEIPVVRDCIRIRKNEITSLEWDIVVSRRALQSYHHADPSVSRIEIERALRNQLSPEVTRLTTFWQQPDWQQGENFVDWCTKLLEEHLVLDACAIYPYQNVGKDRPGFRLLDGSTIKVLVDHQGGRPMPPYPAYQQILWGFPRGEYTADIDDDGAILNGYDADRLIYKRREVRTFTRYGFSATEQALQDIDLYLRRFEWDKAQYTDGVQPSGWILNDGHEPWTPQQLLEYNRAFNEMYAGQTLQRMRYHLLPPGMRPLESADIPEKYKSEYHLHLIKLVCMHFDTTLAELGFVESRGLGTSGYHEGQENVQERKATRPTLQWLQKLITEISHSHLGMPPELEFKILGLDSEDQAAADVVLEQQLKTGRITWNEAREEMGRAPYDFAEANMPVVLTPRGLIFVENVAKFGDPGELVEPMRAPPIEVGSSEGTEEAAEEGEDEAPPPVLRQRKRPKPVEVQERHPFAPTTAANPGLDRSADAVKAEVAAYRKFLRNGTSGNRPFEFHVLSGAEVTRFCGPIPPGVAVRFRAKAVEGDPKAAPGQWPGWERDEQAAEVWGSRLAEVLTGATSPNGLARRWLTRSKAASSERDDAEKWLAGLALPLASELRRFLAFLYAEGYLIGSRAALALLAGEAVDWTGWTLGDGARARAVLNADGWAGELDEFLSDAAPIADQIADHRRSRLAGVLLAALAAGWSESELADALRAAYSTEWARMVALTELTRASSAAAGRRYTGADVAHVRWQTAEDMNVCGICVGNEDAGPLPVGEAFPSGATQPPQHPSCRCALLPVTH